jgi:pseudaminic acid biosynthesis-associated methylase
MTLASDAETDTPTQQLALWKSEFGRAYTDRNDHDNPARVDSLRRVLGGLDPASVLEVGCNAGWNLTYLARLGFTGLHGIEPQRYALDRARARLGDAAALQLGNAFALPFADAAHDLVFTSGVLIHIGPADLPRALDEIYRVARRWIAVVEYDHADEVEVSYRGHAGALWKRDHGARWRVRFPQLLEIRTLQLSAQDGYDDCTAHVFAKPERAP